METLKLQILVMPLDRVVWEGILRGALSMILDGSDEMNVN